MYSRYDTENASVFDSKARFPFIYNEIPIFWTTKGNEIWFEKSRLKMWSWTLEGKRITYKMRITKDKDSYNLYNKDNNKENLRRITYVLVRVIGIPLYS